MVGTDLEQGFPGQVEVFEGGGYTHGVHDLVFSWRLRLLRLDCPRRPDVPHQNRTASVVYKTSVVLSLGFGSSFHQFTKATSWIY